MNDDNIISIRMFEEISNNALPSLNSFLYDGWLLRSSFGFTKRANSVSPLYPSYLDLNSKINFCESFYKKKGLPLIFKLFDDVYPEDLDKNLKKRDYKKYDNALVMYKDMDNEKYYFDKSIVMEDKVSENWIKEYFKLYGHNEFEKVAFEMFKMVSDKIFTVTKYISEKPVAFGMGVIEREYVGIYNIRVNENFRRKGFGQEIVNAILNNGKREGSKKAYLQVEIKNENATALYYKMGFKELYKYWYRKKF